MILLMLFIMINDYLLKPDIVEGLSGREEYFKINSQKYKIKSLKDKNEYKSLKDKFEENNKKFENYKKLVHKHGKAIAKNLGKKIGVNVDK